MIHTLSHLILINYPDLLSLELGNILKYVNNLIEILLGGISKNDFWVMENSFALTSPQSFETRTPPMLQKLKVISHTLIELSHLILSQCNYYS